MEIKLPGTWVKLNIIDEFPVFFDWRNNHFSFSPIMDSLSFVEML
jgi:hypothetical protein